MAHLRSSRRTAVLLWTAATVAISACGSGATAGARPRAGTVFGTISAGPTCPVERADEPCPPAPLAIAVTAYTAGHAVAKTRSTENGDYTLRLRAGRYELQAMTNRALPRCAPVVVNVVAHRRVHADIACDSGIR